MAKWSTGITGWMLALMENTDRAQMSLSDHARSRRSRCDHGDSSEGNYLPQSFLFLLLTAGILLIICILLLAIISGLRGALSSAIGSSANIIGTSGWRRSSAAWRLITLSARRSTVRRTCVAARAAVATRAGIAGCARTAVICCAARRRLVRAWGRSCPNLN